MTYGEKIRNIMEKTGITIPELANKSGISEIALKRYVEDMRIPKAADLIDIAMILKVEPTDLVSD